MSDQNSHRAGWLRRTTARGAVRVAMISIAILFLAQLAGAQERYKANVTVEMDKPRIYMSVRALGIHTSVYDNNLMDADVPDLLRVAGITTLRYPGGGYADNYHFSTYKPTRWQAEEPPKFGYYAPKNDFGHFVQLLERVGGTAIITVNYGSNLAGTGGGEPAEAAAWVAYANGDPRNTQVIGKDSTGYDWQTVGYWASLRASAPLATDDGMNFLRISHPQPLYILYWEVGNEIFGNGWYPDKDKAGYEEDLHAPYTKERRKHPGLSPDTYGKNVVEFAKAMKAVDPSIRIGAVLNTPPMDNSWGPDWNPAVLKAAGQSIDFVVLHWYTGNLLPPDWKDIDPVQLLETSQTELPKITTALLELFQKYCGANAQNIQLAVTEIGTRPWARVNDPMVRGLFAGEAYSALIEAGVVNIDWLELHNNGFLDDKNTPGPAYYAIQMVHNILNPKDTLVNSTSNKGLLTVHAAQRADGSMGLMLINKDPIRTATVKVAVKGAQLATSGTRFDFGKGNMPTGAFVPKTAVADVGNAFEVSVPPYSITDVVIPKAQ